MSDKSSAELAEAVGRRIMMDHADTALEALYLIDEPLVLEAVRRFAVMNEPDKCALIAFLSRCEWQGPGRLTWDADRCALEYVRDPRSRKPNCSIDQA